MPIYEYACRQCGHRFERLVSMSAPPPACPECGAETRKLVSAVAFVLKGSGWYKDHYGLKKSSATASDSSSTAKSGGSSSTADSTPSSSPSGSSGGDA